MRVDLHYPKQWPEMFVEAYQNVAHGARDAIYIYDRHYASIALAYLARSPRQQLRHP